MVYKGDIEVFPYIHINNFSFLKRHCLSNQIKMSGTYSSCNFCETNHFITFMYIYLLNINNRFKFLIIHEMLY